MNRTIKGLIIFGALVSLVYLLPLEALAEKRIGVFIWSEEPRYYESQNGIMDQLRKEGFGEPAVKYTVENARGSKAKAAELVQKFTTAKMDLIFTIGTHATLAAVKAIKDVPIVFSTVYDPVEAGIARDWKSSGNNTTGACTRIPMTKVVNSLKGFAPIKRLAVLYTPGEKNSEAQLLELQKIQADSRITVIPVALTTKQEVVQILPEVIRSVDTLYLTGSSIVGATVPTIVDAANKEKVVTISHLDDLVAKGALLGVCVDSYLVGALAGKKAVKILKGAKPSSIPIETEKKLDIILNRKSAKAGQFQIPPSFMKSVTKVV